MNLKLAAAPSVFPTAVLPIPADDVCGPRGFEVPEIQVALSGAGRRWLEIDRHRKEVKTSPNMIELYGAGYEIRRTRWLGRQGHCVAIQFPRELHERLLRRSNPTLNLKSLHEVFDPRVAQLCRELADETRLGLPSGPLFAEGLSIALIGLLSQRYGPGIEAMPGTGSGFTRGQRKRIEDFIDAELGASLHIALLAALVDLSPSQFSRRFRVSFGLSPHQFILKRRLGVAAAELQAQPGRSIADLAFALGFSSQAHFTEAFRRHTGQTPSLLRCMSGTPEGHRSATCKTDGGSI